MYPRYDESFEFDAVGDDGATPFSLFFRRNFSEVAENVFRVSSNPANSGNDDDLLNYRLQREDSIGFNVARKRRSPAVGSKVLIIRSQKVGNVVKVNNNNTVVVRVADGDKIENLRNLRPYYGS